MNGTMRKDIKPGIKVKVVEKQNQGSGELTEGIVKDILTNANNHSHGIGRKSKRDFELDTKEKCKWRKL